MTAPTSLALQIIRESIAKPKNLDDTVLDNMTDNNLREQLAELDANTLADTLNAIVSEIRQILYGVAPGGRWTDAPPLGLIEILTNGLQQKNISPAGANNCVNIDYTVPEEFVPGTLEIWLDGIKIDPDCYTENLDHLGFQLLIDPAGKNSLQEPLDPSESLRVNYCKKVVYP
jgi:hypothetical protein